MFVQLSNVWFRYPHTDWIIRGISMNFDKGIYALIGPSGSGKTTILRLICGFLKPNRGEIVVLRKRVKSYKDVVGKIIYVPANPYVFVLGPKVYDEFMRLSDTLGIELSPEEILKEAGISDLKDRRIFALSEGQLRLISVALAVFSKVSIILLDEPTVGLDKIFRRKIVEILRKSRNKSIIIATNDLRLASHADFVYAIYNGRIISKGSPSKVFYDKEVAETIGCLEIVLLAKRLGLSGIVTPEQLAKILKGD